ncbi:hypothetical protein TWF694_008421 [Orbilia ellipsospora]|uniref:Uncharacterized protein n=1 Tax=Orbilia ellipsospora TaxID=2528407 RepID=A0AAV9XG13_9PEZI
MDSSNGRKSQQAQPPFSSPASSASTRNQPIRSSETLRTWLAGPPNDQPWSPLSPPRQATHNSLAQRLDQLEAAASQTQS